jgi:hypothetical protein
VHFFGLHCIIIHICLHVLAVILKKLKLSNYRPGYTLGLQDFGVPRFQDNLHMNVVRLSDLCTGRLYPQKIYLVLISVRYWVDIDTVLLPFLSNTASYCSQVMFWYRSSFTALPAEHSFLLQPGHILISIQFYCRSCRTQLRTVARSYFDINRVVLPFQPNKTTDIPAERYKRMSAVTVRPPTASRPLFKISVCVRSSLQRWLWSSVAATISKQQ